jgi:hypothetical protein
MDSNRGSISFEWFVTLSSSLSMGLAAAFIFSIKSVNPSVSFVLTWKTWAAFAGMAWLTFLGCRALLFSSAASMRSRESRERNWFLILGVVGLGGTFAAMAYSLKGVSHEKLLDVGFGVLLAFFFLSILGVLFFQTIRFLKADEEENALSAESGESR